MAQDQDKGKGLYYVKGLPVPETPEPGQEPRPWKRTDVVGQRRPRVDGYDRLSGSAVYPSDLKLAGMLYAAIVRCPHPHAKVKGVDDSKAREMPGVRAVIHQGSPGADLDWPYGGGMSAKLFDPHCRFEGETVAAVAADTPYRAWDAARAVAVDYQVLDFVSDYEKALEPGAAQVHPDGNRVSEPQTYTRGDVAQGFAEAHAVLERTYRTAAEIHTPMEPHGCVAAWEGDALTIWESTQGVYAVQSTVAKVLGLPLAKVRVSGHYMGGGFGSKLDASKYTVIAALLAKESARPVKLVLTREETFLAVGNRPPATMRLKAGVKKDGALTALEMEVTGTGGAYPAGGTFLVDWLVKDNYLCPNVKTVSHDVFIHAGPARPFRAPGHPQGSWALEQMLDELAEKIGLDPVELRLRNIPQVSQGREGNPPYTSTGLAECLQKGAEAFGWAEARKKAEATKGGRKVRGVGMGGAVWFVGGGGPPSTIIVKLFADGSVNLNMGASDIGTGTKTVMALVAAEELGVEPASIQIENADTGTTQYATPSGGSKTVPTEAPTVRNAAIEVKRQLLQWAAEDLEAPVESLRYLGRHVQVEGEEDRRVAVTDISKLNQRGVAVGVGYRGPNPQKKSVNPFAAQFCEVEVDTATGEVRVLRFLGAHDSGRVMDRLTYDNQVFGGIVMGVGFGLTEFRVLDHGQTGKLCNRNWHDYKLPTALDAPAGMTSLPIELDDPEANNTGAKGLGEPVTIPTGSALANAVAHATGLRMYQGPINPATLLGPLAARGKES
jgi:xanthine dehydrogenase YagR molybdenum-binding subunit